MNNIKVKELESYMKKSNEITKSKYFGMYVENNGLIYIILGDGTKDISKICKTHIDFNTLSEQIKGIVIFNYNPKDTHYNIDAGGQYIYGFETNICKVQEICDKLDNYIDTYYKKEAKMWSNIK